jgi:hypothetical protein
MISPSEIKIKAERKYLSYLQSIIQGIPFSKIVILCDKNYSKSIAEFEKEIIALVSNSKEKKGYGFTIDYQLVKTKNIGTQSLPTSIYFNSEIDFLKFLGKEKEVEYFILNWKKIVSLFPELQDWIIKNPQKIIQHQNHWDGILKVCNYFKNNPKPKLYIRELPINLHTKFVESNKTIISEILEEIIPNHVNQSEKDFEKRYNLKFREPLIRFKILDKILSHTFFSGIDDISIPLSQFEYLRLPLKKVIIVENKTTLFTTLTLPKMNDTIAIFGSGYGVSNLKKATWLNDVEILYWGDIDVQGFEILSQLRGYFNHTKSILMDIQTFEKFFENDSGTPTTVSIELNLTETEKLLYNKLKINNWRLEQEKIPYDYVNHFFKNHF